MSYRVAIWYVGAGAAWKFGQRPRPSRVYARSCISCISCISCWGVLLARPQGVPPVQGQLEVWKLGCLEVWLSVHPFHPSRACRAFRSLWPWKVWRFAPARSVLCSPGRVSAPCPVGGSRPLIGFNLRNRRFPILAVLLPSCSFVVLREPSCQPRRANLPRPPSALTRRALAARSVLRSLFSVLREGRKLPLPLL